MNTDQFWNLIETAGEGTTDSSVLIDRLKNALASLPAEEIQDFETQLNQRLTESYRWDLWAVAYIVNGGSSDDGFEYFRGWLISQGRAYFEAALRDPQRAADRAEFDANECEDIIYVAASIYKEKTGEYPPPPENPIPLEPAGEPWEEDDLEELYPDLCKRFS